MNISLKIAIIILFGIAGGKVSKRLNLPNVTGYLLAGLLLGPSFLKLVTPDDAGIIEFVNEFALGIIAFAIGGEFFLPDLKKLGKDVFVITVMEVVGVLAIVFVMMRYVLGQSFVFSIIIASMSAATAPAGTVMIIKQYRADGPLTRTILPVAALDDVLGIIAFGICMSLAKISIGATGDVSKVMMFAAPFLEIIYSIGLGFVVGYIFTFLSTKIKSHDHMLCLILVTILGTTGLANMFGISALLCNMVVGATACNLNRNIKRIFDIINEFAPPIHLLFFTFAGASLNLSVLKSIGFLGVVYALSRAIGKISGATIGAKMVNAPPRVQKWLGLALLPQGGISIGLSMIVARELPDHAGEIITVILFSVLVFEIMGPILAKISITKAGEVDGVDKTWK
uniref:cation:proton antiporter n=1 Tax=Ezakiella massiliensis TaxID=1852374 RepID=UPI00094E770D|nr:cation:proton antiporter [Ezakiella massiliensis]